MIIIAPIPYQKHKNIMSSESAPPARRITAVNHNKPSSAPATILREIRKVACFHSLQFVYRKNGMSDETQHLTLGRNVKGDETIRGSFTKLLLGEEAFAALYDDVPTPDGAQLYLKEIFTSNACIANKHFDQDILLRSAFSKPDSPPVQNRTLFDAAKESLKLCKKAQSLVPKLVGKIIYLNAQGLIERYHSGLNEEDFLMHINDGMYMLLKSDKNTIPLDATPEASSDIMDEGMGDGTDASGSNDNQTPSSNHDTLCCDPNNAEGDGLQFGKYNEETTWMPFGGGAPKNYRFPGFMVYACYGPHSSFFSDLINPNGDSFDKNAEGGSAMKKRNGRDSLRKEEAKFAKTQREHGVGHGLNLRDKAVVCSIAQGEEAASQRDREGNVAVLLSAINIKEKACQRKWKLLDYETDEAEKKVLMDAIKQLDKEIEQHNKEMLELRSDRRSMNPIIKAIMEQVAESMGVADESNLSDLNADE